ncbi:MAG TPA: HPP family protein [Hypericibacter adhaerens]|jgi:CBS-domain-containing membrane protein|uniref:HPP transmembrane region domain-containing protein n=1 Tax=Hypericibacter adhaerens TaxID=2602016 RepID=A0A5J6MVH0_9PROT|nr:HPP family protein [Hypericibacter adhaerens]QEX20725.1 hypothetical protein FRZ61_06440 [Hypericibacter adhaerens]HWA42527.1 HPP family protein [Hypericibacter adhaerens]
MPSPEDQARSTRLDLWRAPVVALLRSRPWRQAALAALGGFIAIAALAQLTDHLHTLLLIAPFGASCVLVFAVPASPLAQPRNLIGGHLLSSLAGLVILAALGDGPWALGLGVALAILLMVLSETVHPPAGADPIVIISTQAAWPFLLAPVLAGTLIIFGIATLYHRHVSRLPYPASKPK